VNERSSLALPEECRFVGRKQELTRLEQWLVLAQKHPTEKSAMALWGLSGAGKSQMVSKFVRQRCLQQPKDEVFWVTGSSIESFEKGILSFLKVSNEETSSMSMEKRESHHEQRKRLTATFFTELRNASRPRWILVIDDLSSAPEHQGYILRHIGKLHLGSLIITTRSKELADAYSHRMEVQGLSKEDAMELLRQEISPGFRQEKGRRTYKNHGIGTDHPLQISFN